MIAEAALKAAPILFCALSFLLARDAGVLNIGAEGQFLAGALAATFACTRLSLGPLAALAAGAAGGAAWAGIAAWLAEKRKVLDVLATILLNFVAAGAVSVAIHGPLQESGRTFPQSDPIPAAARLPILWVGTRVHAGVAIAAVLCAALAIFRRRSKNGFRLRAAGANPAAAEVAGIPVARVRVAAFLAAGGIAGAGGAAELLGVTGRLFDSFSSGYGFVGLAAAVVGGLSPAGAAAASLGFGLLQSAATLLQRRYGISSVSAMVAEAILLLAVLALPRWKRALRAGSAA
jgi:general nucleoside transport system permease protein